VSDVETWRRLAAKGGAFDELAECVRAGKARFRGVSSHHPAVLREALASGLCDVVLFPVGPFVDRRYEEEILPAARRLGVGTVCFKTFGGGMLVGDTAGYGRPLTSGASGLPRLSVETCVRYTLSLDPDVTLLGLSTPAEQDVALAAAASAVPFDEAGLAAVRAEAAAAIAHKGTPWWNPA
jgi:aryl-alcohol dehydrogenase-like predicted oxidoreductase